MGLYKTTAFLTHKVCLLFLTKQILQQINSCNKMAVCCERINRKIILELLTAFYFLITDNAAVYSCKSSDGEEILFHPQNKNPHQCSCQTIWAIQVLT